MKGVTAASTIVLLLAAGACSRREKTVSAASAAATVAPVLPPTATGRPLIRITGLVRAVRVVAIQTPQVAQIVQGGGGPQGNRLTLVTLIPNGSRVKQGEPLAEFDNTRQLDETLDVEAKYDDLGHQLRQRTAQYQSDAEKRISELKQAEADLNKALIQLKKGPVLADVERVKNEIKAESARARVESLKKSHASRLRMETAQLKILDLQQQRQKVALDRSKLNAEKLIVKAPLAGMIALDNIWKGGTMGHPREGDQLWPGQPLMKIFDPSEMVVDAQVGEPDNARLTAGTRAKIQLDAYPGVFFDALFDSASPVATTALGSPVKNFRARFRLQQSDPRLLPDLSAAVLIEQP